MSVSYIAKTLSIGAVLLLISYFFSRAIYAQICTTLTIPFKKMDDINIYDISIKNMPNKLIVLYSLPLVVSGSVALNSQFDPEYHKLIIFILCIFFYLSAASILSYSLFKRTVANLGLKWPPDQSAEKELR